MSILSSLVKPLAYISLPVILLHTIASSSPLARYYIRLGLYLSTIGLCSAWGALVSIGMTLIGRRFDINFVVARSFYHVASRLLGIRVEVEGEEHLHTPPAVVVSNHQSMLDVLYLGRVFPRRASIMGKKELQWMPLLGQYMLLSGAVFVDRSNNASAVKSLADAGRLMKARSTSLWLFPEGTRSMREHNDMLAFKKGAFHLAVQAGVPIVPVVCENYWRIYRKGVLGEGVLKIKVLPPVATDGLTAADVPELTLRIRDQMLVALGDISVPLVTAPLSRPEPAASIPEKSVIASEGVERPSIDIREVKREGEETIGSSKEESPSRRSRASDNGTETEEDEGMVLVGRPSSGGT